MGTLFGKAAANVIVTPQHFMLVAAVGGILLVAAVLVSSISSPAAEAQSRSWHRWSEGGRNDMNLGLRAILYTARKWKKTLLVFCLLLAITTLVLSGLAIADAQEEQAEEVRGTTGASFTVQSATYLRAAGPAAMAVLTARRNLCPRT